MQQVTVSQLKNRLSAYLKKVRAGQTILGFERGEPVARLERVEAAGASDDRLTRLERAGLLRRGGGKPDIASLRAAALPFVCLDDRLSDAASREGFRCGRKLSRGDAAQSGRLWVTSPFSSRNSMRPEPSESTTRRSRVRPIGSARSTIADR